MDPLPEQSTCGETQPKRRAGARPGPGGSVGRVRGRRSGKRPPDSRATHHKECFNQRGGIERTAKRSRASSIISSDPSRSFVPTRERRERHPSANDRTRTAIVNRHTERARARVRPWLVSCYLHDEGPLLDAGGLQLRNAEEGGARLRAHHDGVVVVVQHQVRAGGTALSRVGPHYEHRAALGVHLKGVGMGGGSKGVSR
eukprot:376127-Prorocentrum_minimum.AAC.3